MAFIPNDQGVPDVPERVHWDEDFARRVGVPTSYDFGPQRVAWLAQVVTNWMGDDGFIVSFRGEVRRFNLVGDTHWLQGRGDGQERKRRATARDSDTVGGGPAGRGDHPRGSGSDASIPRGIVGRFRRCRRERAKSGSRAFGKAEGGTNGPPLAGLRILDLCEPEGQLCGRLLADLGAEVIKVEPPEGDPGRRLGPFAGKALDPEASLSFFYFNANKKSIVLDLTAKEGRERLKALAKDIDVILETSPPGDMQNWGLGHSQLSKENPGLVTASITGFGLSGPHSGYKAPSILCSAMGGVMYLCGSEDRPPLVEPMNQPYHLASAFAAAGVLLALQHRESTGSWPDGRSLLPGSASCPAARVGEL